MHVRITRFRSSLYLLASLSTTGVAVAAGQDLGLVNAVAEQDAQTVPALLESGVNVNTPQADGATALLWAAHWNDLETAELLLRAGANVNAANDYGVTPLALACENVSAPMVEKLLKAGADPNAAQSSGLTPLMIAARTGKASVVKALLAHGANVNATVSKTHHSALMWAAAEERLDIAQMLIGKGADVHARSTTGFTPLMFAARNGDIKMAKALIAAGVDVNETGSDGTHALPLAIMSAKDEFALFLLEQGADANASVSGVPALHVASGEVTDEGLVSLWLQEWVRRNSAGGFLVRLDPSRRLPLVKALLAHGADPNARISSSVMRASAVRTSGGAFSQYSMGIGDLKGATPVWVAAWGLFGGSSSPDIIRELMAAGADPHLTTSDQTTPLMVAAGLGHPSGVQLPGQRRGERNVLMEEGVKILVQAGVNLDAANEAGFTALLGAAHRGLNEVIVYLVEQGADINAANFEGQTPFRIAQGAAHMGAQWWAFPETAEVLAKLGADTTLGVSGRVLARRRDIGVEAGEQPQSQR